MSAIGGASSISAYDRGSTPTVRAPSGIEHALRTDTATIWLVQELSEERTQAIDPTTGQVVTVGGVIPSPNNILASVMTGAGYDTQRLRTSGLPCLMA